MYKRQVASFTLDTELLQTVYGVGYKLDLSLLNINLVTEDVYKRQGKLSPLAPITRAEFSQVLYQLAGNIAEDGKTADANLEGNLIVRKSDASLSNVTVKGDLVIADGAQRVKLDNVKVEGRILVRGGADGVEFSKTTAGKGVLAVNPNPVSYTHLVEEWPYQTSFTLEHLQAVLNDNNLTMVYRNSIFVAVLTAVLGLIITYGAALVTARSSMKHRWKGKMCIRDSR